MHVEYKEHEIQWLDFQNSHKKKTYMKSLKNLETLFHMTSLSPTKVQVLCIHVTQEEKYLVSRVYMPFVKLT